MAGGIEMILFREHRGLLSDSMDSVKEVSSVEDILNIINSDIEWYSDLRLEFYGYDNRIDWNTYIVMAQTKDKKGEVVVGFINYDILSTPIELT